MDLQENQLTYINEHWKPTNLGETIVKVILLIILLYSYN